MASDRNLYAGYGDVPADPYEESARGPSRRMRLLTGGIAFLALAGFTIVVWYAYTLGIRAGTESVAPLIRADGRPTKIRPEQPGGMQIPHQDKEVYDTIETGDESTRVEVILPPPEAPLTRPTEDEEDVVAATEIEVREVEPVATPVPPPPSSIAELLEAVEAEEEAAATPMPVPNAPEPLLPPSPPPEPTPEATPVLVPAPAPTPAPEPLPELAIVPESGSATIEEAVEAVGDLSTRWRVQIAALRSEAKALTEWERFKGAHPDLLGDLILEVQRADLGPDKGIFYRLRAGPLADKTAAASLCVQLKVRGLGCLVVRPE